MKAAQRDIFHVDIDAFFAGVEQARDPKLAGKPVIVCGDPSGRSVVSCASYEARSRGVRSAMPLSRARRLCPEAALIRADFEKYRRAAAGLLEIFHSFTPDVEPVSIDEAYLDLTGCRRLHGAALEAADRIKAEVKRSLKLDASIGIGRSRIIAKIASSLAKPNGILRVIPGHEREFLSPLRINTLPGVGEKLGGRLLRLGVRTVGELAAIDRELLALVFGKTGEHLHLASRGIGRATASRGRKSISREITFARDTADRPSIETTLSRLAEKGCNRLRELGLLAGSLTVKLRYADFDTVTRSSPLSPSTDVDFIVFRRARELLKAAYRRRLKLRLVGISLGKLHCDTRWPDLFNEYRLNKYKNLYFAVDEIRRKYDFTAISSARSLQRLEIRKHQDTRNKIQTITNNQTDPGFTLEK